MKKPSDQEPKKRPKQERSRLTVGYILNAAAHILGRDGPSRLNTNRIAEKAGVAVASLYQYFPNKESIVNALFELQLSEERAEFTARSAELKQRPIREVIRVGVQSMISVHAKKPGLVKSILEAIPILGTADMLVRARQQVVDAVSETIRERSREIRRPANADMKAFLIVHCVEGAIHAAATERQEYLSDPAFADEIVDLIDRFVLDA